MANAVLFAVALGISLISLGVAVRYWTIALETTVWFWNRRCPLAKGDPPVAAKFRHLALVLPLLLLLTSCASVPRRPGGDVGVIFEKPLADVRAAAIDALVVCGFDIKKEEDNYLQGLRPRKMGLFVGSGGETVGVWFDEQGAAKTYVEVNTAKSFVGLVGQKNWNNAVLGEMKRLLE